MTVHSATAERLLQQRAGHYTDDSMAAGFMRLVNVQKSMSADQLRSLHTQWLGPQGVFAMFSAEVERLGRQAPALDEVALLDSPHRVQEAELAVVFALAQSHRRGAAINPFSGRTREDLCCLVFDESITCTLAERYAAYEVLRRSDSDFFIKLIATTRGVVERRIFFQGLLEHFDRLLPVEKSIYPGAYRDVQQAHLEREEGLYGALKLSDSLVTVLETISPLDLLNKIQSGANITS